MRFVDELTRSEMRDDDESMFPNIDSVEARKLASWVMMKNDRGRFVGWSSHPSAVGLVPDQPGFLINFAP